MVDIAPMHTDRLLLRVIPRFRGDVDDPRGGVRHVIPGKGNYLAAAPLPQRRPQPTKPATGVCLFLGFVSRIVAVYRGTIDVQAPLLRTA